MSSSNGASSSSFDQLMIQSLMSRLQLGSPYLDANSLDDFFLNSDSDSESDSDLDPQKKNRKVIAKEESKLEKEIIKIINSGNGYETLKPNSGQSVSIGDHNICVGVHDEKGSEYRVWEWHGHVMFFDEEDGYSAEYVYGNYFERVVEKREKDDEKKVKGEGGFGLKDLIGGGGGTESVGKGVGRVIHRNSINAGSSTPAK